MDRAFLIALQDNKSTKQEVIHSLDELSELCRTLEINVVDQAIQALDRPTSRFFIGSGKVLEIKRIIDILDISIVIFDDTLSPAQLRNLEKALEVQIMDRSFLILQIFAQRAQTKEAVLEVELAQKSYMLPRLVGMYKSLSRQGGSGGGFTAKGPGETKLETDRRRLQNDITRIKRELKIIEKEKYTARQRRIENKIPVVALVGYTNAGKSALMNSITKTINNNISEDVFVKDMLFATLDTKSRRLQKENHPPFILVDTVGFISKLPHELINSFKSTLSDVRDADLILHVIDGARLDPVMTTTTNTVLKELNAHEIERINILTKKDLISSIPHFSQDYIFVSNENNENIDLVINTIYEHIFKQTRTYILLIPFSNGNLFNELKQGSHIIELEYTDNGYKVKVALTETQKIKFNQFNITA